MTGNLDMRNNRIYNLPTPKSYVDSKFLKLSGGTMSGTLAMGTNKITGLAETTANGDGVNLRTLNTYITKPCDHTNRFAYLMNPTNGLLQWTDLLGDSIALNSIGDLNTTSGNYHTYNKKVIYASIPLKRTQKVGIFGNWLSNAFAFKKTKNIPYVWKSLL